ncbi:MAG: hypothetical protein MUQ58_01190 [Burkholderiaceae bacterium]|nr:hypothetical protein [Burkholderiaceae bacterium]
MICIHRVLGGRLGTRLPWLLVCAATLVGCASAPKPQHPEDGAWHGKLSVVLETTPRQRQRVDFDLYGSANRGELHLLSPLGTTVAQATWAPGKATIRKGNEVAAFDSLDALSREMLEAPLPVAALFGWLKGMDAPAPGWRVDLCQVGKGRVQAVREWPQPTAKLNLVFEPAPAPATTPLNADVCANPN